MANALTYLNSLQLSSVWEILFGAVIALLLVYFVEFLRKPDIQIEKANDLVLQDGRKRIIKI